jgi:hypothetical protein
MQAERRGNEREKDTGQERRMKMKKSGRKE